MKLKNNKTGDNSALEIARFIVNMQREEPALNISHLKLQKLVFYCQAFHLAEKGKPMFREDVVAWQYGPVIAEVYDAYKKCGNIPISPEVMKDQKSAKTDKIPGESLSTISSVMEALGHLSPIALMEQSHREDPWRDAYAKGEGTVISHDSMKKYYKKFIVEGD